MTSMEYPQLLFVKVSNAKYTKLLNGTDGALICDLVIDGSQNEYQPFDIILRRPKSNAGIQKNTFIFHLPSPSPKFQLIFKKKYKQFVKPTASSTPTSPLLVNNTPTTTTTTQNSSSDTIIPTTTNELQPPVNSDGSSSSSSPILPTTTTTTTPTTTTTTTTTTTPPPQFCEKEIILGRVNVSLQYSTLPTIPRRSSFNSLSTLAATGSNSLNTSNDHNNNNNNNELPNGINGTQTSSSTPTTPIMTSVPTQSIAINGNSGNNSPILSGSPSSQVGGGSLSGSPGGYPVLLQSPYSISAPSSPSESILSGSPSFITLQNQLHHHQPQNRSYHNSPINGPVPITASNSISSPALATINDGDEAIRIETSLRWYKIQLENGTSGSTQTTTIVNSTSFNSLAGMITYNNNANNAANNGGNNIKDSESESTVSSDDPEIQLQISYENSNAHNLTRIKAYHKDLLDLVVTSKLGLVHAICDSVDITAAQSLAKSLVDVFHSHHKLLHLLKSFLKKEVSLCHDPGTLFRSNSVAMKMVVAYGHKTAQHYLQQTLTPLIVDLCNSPLSLEVDPIKLPQGEDVELNIKNLRIVAQKFFDRIVQSFDQCPKSIIEICYYFKKIVSKKFPTHWRSAVGGFIFLRLICPACVSPENAGIISSGRVGITERRALVLVAKCIQNLSNQVLFNQTCMETINDFIHNNTPTLEEFFMKLATRQPDDQTIDGMMVSEESLHEGILYLQNFIEKNQDKVFKALENNTTLPKNDIPKENRILDAVESSKKAVLNSSSSISALFNKSRSYTTVGGVGNGAPNKILSKSDENHQVKKYRSNSEHHPNNNSSNSGTSPMKNWSSLVSKNLKAAKQTITPTLNLNFPKSQEEEIKVINIDYEWSEKPRPVHLVVCNLLRNLTNLCKSNRLTDTQSLKMNGQLLNWVQVQTSNEFAEFIKEVHELQSCYFENMTMEYITSVFINLFNLLIIHLHFLLGPPNSEVRRKLYQLHKYNVGGNLYSLNDIQHGILRGNPKNALSRVRQIRGGDKRRTFVLNNLDPRIHFALFAVNITLPCMRIFSPDQLLEDLHKCGEEFCSAKIDICVKKKEISLPKVFSHYGTDFGKSRSEMLKWIFQFLISNKRTELLELLEKPSFICLYRSESWNPITYKTKFINDLEEKEIEKKESEKKKEEKEKLFRRKSRSLTHGNRASPTTKKDSSAITLIHTLKQTANESTKKILSTLNEIIKNVSESLDINYINVILNTLKITSKQLSFNEWKKASTGGNSTGTGGSGTFGLDKAPMAPLKPQNQLFSNMQMYCLSPTLLNTYAPPLQELYATTLKIEKEMNKFIDFMDIASFAQNNDIAELILDISNELTSQFNQLKSESKDEVNQSIKETLGLTISYFVVQITTKSQTPQPTISEESLMNSILKELGFDDSLITSKKYTATQISQKIQDISKEINACQVFSSLNNTLQKIKRIGKLLSLYEEQTLDRFSPRPTTTTTTTTTTSH